MCIPHAGYYTASSVILVIRHPYVLYVQKVRRRDAVTAMHGDRTQRVSVKEGYIRDSPDQDGLLLLT